MEDVEQRMENNPDQDDDSEDGDDEATSVKFESSSEKVSNLIVIFLNYIYHYFFRKIPLPHPYQPMW